MLKTKYIINIILISFIISLPIISFKEREIPNLKISKEEAKIKIFNFLREGFKISRRNRKINNKFRKYNINNIR